MIRTLLSLCLALAVLPPSFAAAADCAGNPNALGTGRVLAVDPTRNPAVGRKHFPQTLPLQPKEIVLTFDDGPLPETTERVLAALKAECVRATFFMLGRNAAAYPALARRVLADGHTVAHHTYRHPLLNQMSAARAEAEIEHGIAAVETAAHGKSGATPRTPFFRFPGFASSPALLASLKTRGIAVFGADLWSSDWNRMTPEFQRAQLLQRLAATGGGIVLMHDTQQYTSRMLPELLRELKRRGYRVVHIVPDVKKAR